MTRFDGKRLSGAVLDVNWDKLRRGQYADQYFINVMNMLAQLQQEGAIFAGEYPRVDATPALGDIMVEAQIFNRRAPRAVVAGVDVALAVLRHGTGYFDGDMFVETWPHLKVEAVQDGDVTMYDHDPAQVMPVLKIQGRYREFVVLETTLLGYLTRATRIATNVSAVLEAAQGKTILFFPARFDLPVVQALDGYAYWLAVQRYNALNDVQVPPLVSTDEQAAWWGGQGGGTVPHAIIACFLADTAEAMKAFARIIDPDVPRIALVDFNNETVRDSLRTLDACWPEYVAALHADDAISQKRWKLNGVRLDTSKHQRDAALPEDAEKGVSPALVRTVREALNTAWTRWNVPAALEDTAKAYCAEVQIVVSGGFNAQKIAAFEADNVPVDSYGVGSTFFTTQGESDYTMDVVRVWVDGGWVDMPKVGRQPNYNDDLAPVNLEE